MLDQLGAELLGSVQEWNKIIYEYAKSLRSKGNSTITSYGDKNSAQDAAFVNSTFGQGAELDDVAFGSAGHPSVATVPVALAMGEKNRLDGKALITAIVAEWDVMYRIMSATNAGEILGLNKEHPLAYSGSKTVQTMGESSNVRTSDHAPTRILCG